MAVVWCNESITGRSGLYGDGLLLMATQQADFVCVAADDHDVADAGTRLDFADERLADATGAEVHAPWVWGIDPGAASLDRHRRFLAVAESERRVGTTTPAATSNASGRNDERSELLGLAGQRQFTMTN